LILEGRCDESISAVTILEMRHLLPRAAFSIRIRRRSAGHYADIRHRLNGISFPVSPLGSAGKPTFDPALPPADLVAAEFDWCRETTLTNIALKRRHRSANYR
jgi:hypothetical protein